jgi:predicted transposase YdaD
VEVLAGLRFDKDLIRQFFREDIMKESVIYQDIVQKEALKMINRLLKRRFGDVNDPLMTKIRNLSADDLEDLGEALFDFSDVADLVTWLNQKVSN